MQPPLAQEQLGQKCQANKCMGTLCYVSRNKEGVLLLKRVSLSAPLLSELAVPHGFKVQLISR